MDCFVAPLPCANASRLSQAMRATKLQTHRRIPATHRARVVANSSAPEGVGNAGCPMHRSRACSVVNTRVSHHGYTGSPGIPARNGFNGFLRALPGDRACLPPSLRESPPRNLTPASGRQDHTTSPSASAPFVKGASTSTASRPASVTIAIRPSSGTRRCALYN
jgi:hypothetical protein